MAFLVSAAQGDLPCIDVVAIVLGVGYAVTPAPLWNGAFTTVLTVALILSIIGHATLYLFYCHVVETIFNANVREVFDLHLSALVL